jgi:hypothetical protein
MFVHPTRLKTLGAAIVGTLALGACEDPVADTDLRPEGDPEILAVLVMNDTENAFVESATYCKPNDPKRPGAVGITVLGINPVLCPLDGTAIEPLTDAYPDAWYIRVMFDELLDPEVETLEPILDANGNPSDNFTGSLARTQPVTLQCQDVTGTMVDVEYDGYYSPAGNRVTWPVGPSLVIQPLDPTIVPVESMCQVTLKESIKDKDGNSIKGRDIQPFEFSLAPVSVIAVSPGEGDAVNPTAGGVELAFNVEVDGSAVFCADPADAACTGDPTRLFAIEPAAMAENAYVDNFGTGLFVGGDLLGDQTYTFKAPAGMKIKDKCGKESTVAGLPADFEFDTNPIRFVSFNPGGGNAVAPAKKITLSFNQLIDTASFVEGTDFEMNPKPANFAIFPPPGNPTPSIQIRGDYNIGTRYTLTIKAGAQIADAYNKQMIDFPMDRVTDFTTTGTIAITAQAPANNARITKPATAAAAVRRTFNQEMDATSLDPATEFTLTKADGTGAIPLCPAVTPVPQAAQPCTQITASGATVSVSALALPAGSYKFTLNAGATLTDKIAPTANTYTQAAAREISFTVADAAPPGPAFKCLGAP